MLYGGRFDISMALALTGCKLDLEFVKNDDPDFYKHVSWMKTNPVEGLELDFTRIRKYYDAEVHVDLKPDGKNIPVTDANKNEYIELMLQDKYFGGRRKEM
jgi:E3 ubiquitin-protein ligase HUWE1